MSCIALLVPTQHLTGFRWELAFCIFVQAGEMVTGHRAGADSLPRKPLFQGPWCLPGHPRGLSSLPRHQEVCKSHGTGLSPGSLGSRADGRTFLPHGLARARCVPRRQALTSSLGAGAVALLLFMCS